MSKRKGILDVGNLIFWIILLVIILLILPFFKNGLYNDNQVNIWLTQFDTLSPKPNPIIENDTLPEHKNDTTATLRWLDFNRKRQSITYRYQKNALEVAKNNRLNGNPDCSVYAHMYLKDKVLLKDLIMKMRTQIKHKQLNYLEAIEYVCSSIQYFKYTLINAEEPCPCQTNFGLYDQDCSDKTGNGCCTGVFPFAVYSPFEFIYQHTGDCDTRALTAFTILKSMGFDAAVMVSNKKSHSVLGVVIPGRMNSNLSMGVNNFGKKYILWELTSEDWRLGDGVSGRDWIAELE